ncbi:MAG: hypothetical protein AAB619_01950 [Patescibacteria group bacterium]
MNIYDFIKQRKHLVWSTNNYDGLSNEAIVEATLNYGDWNDVKELIEILGIRRVATIFRRRSAIPRSNYRPEISHYFQLYFGKYA